MEDNALGVERASEGKTVAPQPVPLLVTLTMVLPTKNALLKLLAGSQWDI